MTIADFGIEKIYLASCHTGEKDEIMRLVFYIDIPKDNAWYQIDIGDYESHKFNSIKKVIKFWNKKQEV